MEPLISIFREVRDPRDFNARHDLSAMLFIGLAATLCGAKSCVDVADFAAANEDELAEIVDLRYGAPSHDCFSRVFRLLDSSMNLPATWPQPPANQPADGMKSGVRWPSTSRGARQARPRRKQ